MVQGSNSIAALKTQSDPDFIRKSIVITQMTYINITVSYGQKFTEIWYKHKCSHRLGIITDQDTCPNNC